MTDAPRRRLPQWIRWLHIYLSMIAFAATMLFAVTGFTLNHRDWFEGGAPSALAIDGSFEASRFAEGVDKLAIAEELRKIHRLCGMVEEFDVGERECSVVWRAPAYEATIVLDRGTGAYAGEVTQRSVVALLNDLHEGHSSGPTWSLIIDIAAVLLTVLSITGLWLLLYLKKRRVSGMVVGFLGGMLLTMSYVFGVHLMRG